jgi:CheY-like chemotaxis protein
VSSKRLSHITIVVVDDNSDVRRFVGAFLAQLGANIALAQSAMEGLEAIKTHRPDIVLSDISMPGRDGFDMLRDIRALAPDAGGSVPVIAMTALVNRPFSESRFSGIFAEAVPSREISRDHSKGAQRLASCSSEKKPVMNCGALC